MYNENGQLRNLTVVKQAFILLPDCSLTLSVTA